MRPSRRRLWQAVAAAEMAGFGGNGPVVRARGGVRDGRRSSEGVRHEDAGNVVGDVREKS
jgi:hypothetical protein